MYKMYHYRANIAKESSLYGVTMHLKRSMTITTHLNQVSGFIQKDELLKIQDEIGKVAEVTSFSVVDSCDYFELRRVGL
jgi:hypothetical protein